MKKDPSRFWNKIAGDYDAHSNARFAEAYQGTIARASAYLKPADLALDFACGTGLTTLPLAGCVRQVEAIDTSSEMLAIARKKAEAEGVANVNFQVDDLFNTRFRPGSFDVVMAFNILYYLKDVPAVLGRIHALLKPGGTFLSATDCMGEQRSLLMLVQPLVSGIGLYPYIKQYTVAALEHDIESGGFEILESANLHGMPPNQFVAARRR